jgi:long-chain acyl-CoA synthetase
MTTYVHFGQVVRDHAAKQPNKVVCFDDGKEITYQQLNDNVTRLTQSFLNLGLKKGDKVVTLLPQSQAFLTVFVAASNTGLTLIPLDTRIKLDRIRDICERTNPQMIIGQASPAKLCDLMTEVLDSIHFEHVFHYLGELGGDQSVPYERLLAGDPVEHAELPSHRTADDPLAIFFTSGTTGIPKGAVVSNGNLLAMAQITAEAWNITSDERFLLQLTTGHVGGVGDLISTMLYTGSSGVTMPKFDSRRMVELFEQYAITFVESVPTMFRIMLKEVDVSSFDVSSVRMVCLGGEPNSAQLMHEVKSTFKGATVAASFGMTETSGFFTYTSVDDDIEVVASTEGRVGPGNSLKIVRHDGSEASVGEAGELWIKGPGVINGYLDSAHNEKSFVDGWLRTGDVGKVDHDGNFAYVGRTKEMYISGGYNVYPREVETFINKYHGISNCCVVERPDELWGEVGVAVIVPHDMDNFDSTEFEKYLDDGLAGYQKPKEYVLVDNLPTSATGKIDKQTIKKNLERYIGKP